VVRPHDGAHPMMQAYFEQGNSDRFKNLIEEAQMILGKENVFILPN